MSRLSEPITNDHITSFFKIGAVQPKLETVPRSALGGRNFDPKTGKAAEYANKTFVPSYKRQPRRNNSNQHAYAEFYKKQEEHNLKYNLNQDIANDAVSMTTAGLEKLESISMTTSMTEGNRILPEGMTEQQATEVYFNYNFRMNYDETLAIYKMRQDIIDTIESNQVTVIQGETGSGKTTQVPQYILDFYAQHNKYCNIIVTQPRRIAAMSIARRVCYERGWEIGRVCGYQVGMDRQMSEDTRLCYCTTGVLLQKLITNKNMNDYTHIILDEVHERDQDTDFALLVIRKMLWSISRDVKVILMSATFESQRFANYFAVAVRGELHDAPVLDIKGRSYTVQEHYLEDLRKLSDELPELDLNDPQIDPQMFVIASHLIVHFDNMEVGESKNQVLPNNLPAKRGSVLVFLPGLAEINDMEEKLRPLADSRKLRLLPLHSTITGEEQARVFDKPTPGYRKIIMSTNIAESSITVPDVKYVIDFCLTKNLMCDPETSFTSLQLDWASKANCKQRMGRAGRVSNGRVYRLVPRRFYSELPDFGSPEMQRCPLNIVVLKTKRLDLGAPKAILGLALDPPSLDDIETTILNLKEVGALSALDEERRLGICDRHDGKLTFLGRVVTDLPLDIHLGKMILLGHVFGLLDECIIISASLAMKSFFSTPYKAHLEAYRKKFEWADDSFSDCLAYLFAYKAWKHNAESGRFPSLMDEMRWARENFVQLRRIKDVEKLVIELRSRLRKFNIVTPLGPNRRPVDIQSEEIQLFLKVVFCGAFYPNYFSFGDIDEAESNRSLSGRDPRTTVMVRGLPSNQGSLYKNNIEQIFSICDSRGKKPIVHFEETKAFVEFHRDPAHSTCKILPAVYMALKIKQLGRGGNRRLEFPQLDLETTRQQLQQLSILQESQLSRHNGLRTNRMCTDDDIVRLDDDSSDKMHQVKMPSASISVIALCPTVIAECGIFWAHYGDPDTLHKLEDLQYNINLNSRNIETLEPGARQIGSMCLALYLDNDQGSCYYRARIERLNNIRQQAEVFFVDYGNVETVPYLSLKQLESHFRGLEFQAFECHLASIKPSSIKCPNGHWTKEAREVFKTLMSTAQSCLATVYSVVHNVIRIQLELTDCNGSRINVNEKLVTLCFADTAEEDYHSKLNHRQREEERQYGKMTIPGNEEASPITSKFSQFHAPSSYIRMKSGQVVLNGPIHPYEISFFSMTSIGRIRKCRVDMNSVNCVAVDSEPQTPCDRMMVAAYVGLNPSCTSVQARDTTILPSIPGLPALMALLFTPTAEMRVSPDRKQYTGALCGLGWDDEAEGPALGENDMEITFDTKFDVKDLTLVNIVRIAINRAIGSEDTVAQWGPNVVAELQQEVRRKFLKLFKKRRDPVPKMFFCRPHHWNQVDKQDILPPNLEFTDDNSEGSLYQLHNAVCIAVSDDDDSDGGADDDDLKEAQAIQARQELLAEQRQHIIWLHSQASRSTEKRSIQCELCDVFVNSPRDLFLHLHTAAHRTREKAIL